MLWYWGCIINEMVWVMGTDNMVMAVDVNVIGISGGILMRRKVNTY